MLPLLRRTLCLCRDGAKGLARRAARAAEILRRPAAVVFGLEIRRVLLQPAAPGHGPLQPRARVTARRDGRHNLHPSLSALRPELALRRRDSLLEWDAAHRLALHGVGGDRVRAERLERPVSAAERQSRQAAAATGQARPLLHSLARAHVNDITACSHTTYMCGSVISTDGMSALRGTRRRETRSRQQCSMSCSR